LISWIIEKLRGFMIVFSLLTGKVRIEKIIGDRGEKDRND
jgi:hypothetical protein